MPQVIAGAIAFVSTTLAAGGTGAFLIRLGATILLSTITSKLFGPKAPPGVGLSGHQITTNSALEYRKIVYGQAVVSGPIVFQNTAGPNLEELWTVIPLCHGRSEAILSIFLDNDEIPVSEIDWTPGVGAGFGSGTGAISTAKFIGENNATAVFAYWALGYDTQPANAQLNAAFSQVTDNFRGLGVTYLILKMIYNVDTEKVWKEGVPSNFKALVKGRLVYNPALDSTNGGSGPHRVNNPSTWEWSDKPPLHVADYLLNFVEVDG